MPRVKVKGKLEALTINESLGDIPTHFMKSGSCYRPTSDLEGLEEFKDRIIPKQYRGSPFQYDIWFNTNALNTVHKQIFWVMVYWSKHQV